MSEEKKISSRRWQIPVICLSAIIIVGVLCFRPSGKKATLEEPVAEEVVAESATPVGVDAMGQSVEEEVVDLLYGIDRNQYSAVYEGDIQQGELLVNLLQPYTSYGNILAIAEKSKGIYDLASKMQIGHHWAVFCNTDDAGESQMEYFVYDINSEDILVVSIKEGVIDVVRQTKE